MKSYVIILNNEIVMVGDAWNEMQAKAQASDSLGVPYGALIAEEVTI